MKNKLRITGNILSAAVLLFCIFGYLLAPNDPIELNMSMRLAGPSAQYPFGTDKLGRCIFSRVLYGGRTTVGIVLTGAIAVIVIGTVIGMLMGSRRGRGAANTVFESILSAVTAIPPIAYLIVFIGSWGNGVGTTFTALVISLVMRVIRLVKTLTEAEFEKAYVNCAIASGASFFRLLLRHIAPNIIPRILQFVFMSCTDMTMSIVSFSFIGLSLGDDVVDWGVMVDEARDVIIMNPTIILFPITAIFISTVAFNMLSSEIGGEENA